ncbi:MAG: hypothetical protein RBT01_16495, partial [Anaerolineaceae bacterium]|nr:hypothetical protein [Anaerolineaceae bacterium]
NSHTGFRIRGQVTDTAPTIGQLGLSTVDCPLLNTLCGQVTDAAPTIGQLGLSTVHYPLLNTF